MLSDDPQDMLKIENGAFGRCFLASNKVPENEVILTAKPFSIVPDTQSKHTVCSCCVAAPTLPVRLQQDRLPLTVKCPTSSDCKLVSYCSEECATSDQTVHEFECSFWRNNTKLRTEFNSWDEYTQDYTTMLIRLLTRAMLEQVDFSCVWKMCDNLSNWSDARLSKFIPPAIILNNFTSHIAKFKFPTFEVTEVVERISKLIASGCTEINVNNITPQLCACLLLICKEECNSFGVYTHNYTGLDTQRQGYGLALYPTAVFFNHSCTPSVSHSTKSDGTMLFVAPNGLEDGQEATISYVDAGMDAKERREVLREWFLFDCSCDKCVDIE
jgi:SET domain